MEGIFSKIKTNYIDSIYEFKGQWGIPSKCGLKVYQEKGQTAVIITELYDENPGTSVTSFCAEPATELLKKTGADPGSFICIIHVPDKGSKLENYSETFGLVKFKWDGLSFFGPEWKRIKKSEVDSIFKK